jgi:hypothetical protein
MIFVADFQISVFGIVSISLRFSMLAESPSLSAINPETCLNKKSGPINETAHYVSTL